MSVTSNSVNTRETPAPAGVRARTWIVLATLVLGIAAAVVSAWPSRAATADAAMPKPTMGNADGSPAEKKIAVARRRIEREGNRADGWNDLALALARRARETAQPAFYTEAWQAAETSLALEPGNLEGQKVQAWILLGQHEFARAVEVAERINKQTPDDVLTYGFLADGYVELGRYEDAEKAAQWMLDMRPGNVPGLTRAAHLRELFGDHEGAVELLDTSYRRTADGEVEDRAWILTQIAHLSLLTCRTSAAEQLLAEALKTFPEYHYAVAQMAEVRTQQGRMAEAATLRERHYRLAAHPENQFELGVALARAGRDAEARKAWSEFETAALAESEKWDNANIELIYYYADRANRPADAVKLARAEASRKQDVRTLEALAWALFKNGEAKRGQEQMAKALAVGISSPVSFYHAGAIAAGAGDQKPAREYVDRSLTMCGSSSVAVEAKALQSSLTAGVQPSEGQP